VGDRCRIELGAERIGGGRKVDDGRGLIAACQCCLPGGAQRRQFGIGDIAGAERVDTTLRPPRIGSEASVDDYVALSGQFRRPRGIDLGGELDETRRGGQFQGCEITTLHVAERGGDTERLQGGAVRRPRRTERIGCVEPGDTGRLGRRRERNRRDSASHLGRGDRRRRRRRGSCLRAPRRHRRGEQHTAPSSRRHHRDGNGGMLAAMASSTLLPIILDCDPGHDDAIAIVVAARHTKLLGITTVAGNAPLESTTRNAIVVRDLLGIDVPVHAGANRPLVAPPRHAGYIHGESGLDGADLPTPSGPPASRDGVAFIIDTVRDHDGVWLVAIGPLTNIALALRTAPDLAARIAGISLMGGGLFGNHTASAEFNIWADPDAAAIVFAYGGPLVMAGLDVTHQFLATPERIDLIRVLPGRLAATLADLLQFFSHTYMSRHGGMGGAAVHDPCAVMALTHPELFTRSFAHVAIETVGEHTRGMTVIDQRTLIERPEPNCDRLTGIDADAAWAVVTEAIANFSS
jgi:inosine-uridine nucleoside N-ribohydrolase